MFISDIRPPMTLNVEQSVTFEIPVGVRNEALARAKKVVENIRKGKKNTQGNNPNSNSKSSKEAQNKSKEEQYIDEIFKIDIPSNPYIASQDQEVLITEKHDKKTNQMLNTGMATTVQGGIATTAHGGML